jgi:2-oxoisovalerate dehydrogenase E1 component alpha subunit
MKAMDNIFYDAQRQGRISFYMTSYGEEAAQFGSAAAIRTCKFVMGDIVLYALLLTWFFVHNS